MTGARPRASLRSGSSAASAAQLMMSPCLGRPHSLARTLHVLHFQPWLTGYHVRRLYQKPYQIKQHRVRLDEQIDRRISADSVN